MLISMSNRTVRGVCRVSTAAALAMAALAPGAALASKTTLLAGRVVAADGTLSGPTLIVIDGELISDVRPAGQEKPATTDFIDRSQAVICPGLIDVRSALGVAASGEHVERVRAVDCDLSMDGTYDPVHADFRRAQVAGVTAAMLVPAPNNVIGGAAQVVRIVDHGRAVAARQPGPLMFALGDSVLERSREPTSRIGAVNVLRRELDAAKAGSGASRLQSFLRSGLDGLIVCAAHEDVSAAAALFSAAERCPTLCFTPSDLDEVEAAGAPFTGPIVLDALGFDSSAMALRMPGVLAKAGKEIVFAGFSPQTPPGALRTSAALAVRYGLDPTAARRALTASAAKVIGMDEKLGMIQRGAFADFVVYSDDPLRLDARVLEVYVGGVRVFDARLEP